MSVRPLAVSFAALLIGAPPASAQKPAGQEQAGVTNYAIEGQGAAYKYKETDDDGSEFMNYKGKRVGVAARATHVAPNEVVTAGEAKLSYGRLDYTGSGTLSDVPDYYYEFRFLAGRRLAAGGGTLTPYLGFGWRHLVNDSSGMTTSTGAYGYTRTSDYYYLPLGADWRLSTGGGYLEINAEYDILLRGTQKSELIGETVKNTQNRGHGFRASALWGQGAFAAGPYLNYWKIAKSTEDLCGGGFFVCWEPKNTTTEAGLRVRYSFQ
jgi:hypothetical protein